MNSDKDKRKELGLFLKSRRSRLSPEQFGLSKGPRRKVPGLRREELAQIAGIGLTWYTWLEQGKDIQVSTQVLDSLVTVMKLDTEERNHLFMLAHGQLPVEQTTSFEAGITKIMQNFMNDFEMCPAYATDQRWDILMWNKAAQLVFGDFEKMNKKERNAVWRCFASTDYRKLMGDWESHAKRLLGQFRSTSTPFVGEDWFKELVGELMELSPEFREWWPRYDIQGTPIGTKQINHPTAGTMTMEHMTFRVYDAPELKLTIYRPLKENDSIKKLNLLMNGG
ncbi:helix-turn-helix transcriptional regulator [Brevibacillus sp. M2.1A]|uniref:helix-turn-helix transcriptional regulator n=1 Tax=Brevibacillus TaxID=55080 RepID=UPI00156BD480|nr:MULTISPECIES: helix-turn-helix transcriptional regulator [Brevibacillus]MCC8433448.1 helix-turn-helix transcriptional regulator [Brevibacillus sp. M2.1A]WJQ81586.1 helix-turn-helix transcriptional regulator [Brevibacillus brevis]